MEIRRIVFEKNIQMRGDRLEVLLSEHFQRGPLDPSMHAFAENRKKVVDDHDSFILALALLKVHPPPVSSETQAGAKLKPLISWNYKID